MSNVQVYSPRFYRYFAISIISFFIIVFISFIFLGGKSEKSIINPKINCNFEVKQVGNEFLYSGEVINNESIDLTELVVFFIDNTNGKSVGYVKFEDLKSEEIKQFNHVSSIPVNNVNSVGFEIGVAKGIDK